jgi:hypothetical protein
MKLRHVLGVPNSGIWKGKDMDRRVKVCGARYRRDIRCDEPYWMGPHTWHSARGGWEQWCDCGNDHHYAADCWASEALRHTPAWHAFVAGAELVPVAVGPALPLIAPATLF